MIHAHRKRNHKSNVKKDTSFIDGVVMVVGIVGPLLTVPQLLTIFSLRSATGVSSISWLGYSLAALIWFTYGMTHKENVVIINSLLNAILCFLVFVGSIVY